MRIDATVALSPGTVLGPYQILSPLGAGGMGEVYKARDTRLERLVAVKVLPAERCASPEARKRFEREAKAISQLSHPHICALHDIGHQETPQGSIDYLVMEHLEGETLGDRLVKGPLPLEQTLRFGIEIADALQKAHRQGIVHRDLKPANVMLTRSGTKLLDFGLAKMEAPVTARDSVTALPTRADLTQEGTILGTMQYMAPEQLEGKEADARTDIFALGTVLYEMAAGRKAFTGTSQASLISAIMKEEPAPIAQVQPMSPAALDHTVKTCLAKDPEERWQSANDVKTQLKWIAAGGAQAAGGAGVKAGASEPARSAWREWFAWGLAAAAAIAAAGLFLRGGQPTLAPASPMRFSVLLPEKSAVRALALSPDGTKVVAVARDAAGRNLLWVRSFDSLDLQPLPGTENPSYPFWSPDGRFIAFFADGKLKKIGASGGPPQTLCDAPVNRGGAWSRDGDILFSPVTDGPLYRVSASGGAPAQATRLNPARGETTHRWPVFLPDGRHFVYLVASFALNEVRDNLGLYVGSLDSPDETYLVRVNSNVAFVPPGYLLFYRDQYLQALPFDDKTLRATGEPLPIAAQIQYFPQVFTALFTASANGTLLYQPQGASSVSQLAWFDRSGKNLGSLGPSGDQSNPRISPDGKRISLAILDRQSGNTDIWIYDAAGGLATRITSHQALEGMGIWSPDGGRIAFSSIRSGHVDLYQKRSNGEGEEETVFQSERTKYITDWSPDGRFIMFRASDATSNLELWVVPLTGDRKPIPFIKTTFGVNNGQFSPDGRFVAYASNESGRWEIYVAPFPGPGGNWKISSDGGSEPRWRRDGKELFFLAPDGHLMAAAVKAGATFDAEPAKPLFAVRRREPVSSIDIFSYDVSPDGQRFLVNTDISEATAPPLTVVLNWTPESKR